MVLYCTGTVSMTQHAKTNKYGVKKGTIESWIELRLRKRDTEIADDSGGKSLHLATTLIKPQHIHLGKTRVIKDKVTSVLVQPIS